MLSYISNDAMRPKRNCLVLSNYVRVILGTEQRWKVPVGGNFRDGFIKISSASVERLKPQLHPVLACDGLQDIASPGVTTLSVDGRKVLEGSPGHLQHC